jgi:prepilin-type N-terminal cleavage/methylation domain-containing protein/prepilin-type processing-associated H-X9-DG protein
MVRNRLRALQQCQRGFTLIELLVVIALITILAGILFPVFAQVRDRARQTTCLSNLRQISLGMNLYEQDYEDRLPPVVSYGPGVRQYFALSWMRLLEPYVKEERVFLCPATGNANPDWRASSDLLYNYGYAPSAGVFGGEGSTSLPLAIPGFGAGLWQGLGGFNGRTIGWYVEPTVSATLAQVARPTETVLVCDHLAFDWGLFSRQFYLPAPRHVREEGVRLPDGTTVPDGRINCVFVDGHVQALKMGQFWSVLPGYTHRNGAPQDVFRHFWPYE